MLASGRWIMVGNPSICEHTEKQLEICEELNVKLVGTVMCDDPQYSESEICTKVPSFPCFCNLDTGTCTVGLRESLAQFIELEQQTSVPKEQ